MSAGEIIQFPIQMKPNDYWFFYDNWAKNGRWSNCCYCKRKECFRAGHWFVGCAYHSDNPNPPEPYQYPGGGDNE